jgi:CRP-like cAMP-binding protein
MPLLVTGWNEMMQSGLPEQPSHRVLESAAQRGGAVPTKPMTRDWVNVLADVPLFAGLSKRHLKRIADLAVTRRVDRYTAIVREGTRGDAFFVILDGSAVVRKNGRRRARLRAGDSFGELALLDGAPRTATVEAEQETLCMQLGRTSFAKMLESEPKVAVSLLKTLAARLREAERSPVA